MSVVPAFVITPEDRRWFTRCRRAWDLGAAHRRDLEPLEGGPDPLGPALRDALAVYYFPGMWTWPRSIVLPLVTAALDRSRGHPGRARPDGGRSSTGPPTVDRFTPVRVEHDVEVVVPDPVISEQALATTAGDAVRFQRAGAARRGGRRRPVVLDRAAPARRGWARPDELALDEDAAVTAWAWHEMELAMPIAGVIHDELRADGPSFRRTIVPLSAEQVDDAGRRLGRTAMAMLDAVDLRPDPTPDWTHCRACPFRPPCLAMNRGEDAEPLLAAHYRVRPEEAPVEGRLGGRTWSTGRGARPNPFSAR